MATDLLNLTVPIVFALHIWTCSSTGLTDAPKTLPDGEVKKELVGKYSVYRKKMTWGDAQNWCEHNEGHLATFINIEDARAVIDKIFEISDKVSTEYLSGAKTAEFGLDRRYWMGLTDLVSGEGNWVWAGVGKPLTYNAMWYPGQPDHIDKEGKYIGRPEHCGALWNPIFHKGDRKHSFVDQECNRLYYFICESDEAKIQTQKEWKNKNPDRITAPLARSIRNMGKGKPPPPSNPPISGRTVHHNSHPPQAHSPPPDQKPNSITPEVIDADHNNEHQHPSVRKTGRTIFGLHGKPPHDHAEPPQKLRAHPRPEVDDSWKILPGFSELFEPSQSTSIEESERENYIEVSKRHLPETSEIFD